MFTLGTLVIVLFCQKGSSNELLARSSKRIASDTKVNEPEIKAIGTMAAAVAITIPQSKNHSGINSKIGLRPFKRLPF